MHLPRPSDFRPAYGDGHTGEPAIAPPGFPGYTGALCATWLDPRDKVSIYCEEMGRLDGMFGNWVWVVRAGAVVRVIGVYGETRGNMHYDPGYNALVLDYPAVGGPETVIIPGTEGWVPPILSTPVPPPLSRFRTLLPFLFRN